MLKQEPDFHFEISQVSEVEITRVDCILSSLASFPFFGTLVADSNSSRLMGSSSILVDFSSTTRFPLASIQISSMNYFSVISSALSCVSVDFPYFSFVRSVSN